MPDPVGLCLRFLLFPPIRIREERRAMVSPSTPSSHTPSKLDFQHFSSALPQVIIQKISSWAMKRSASSIDRTVRPNGPVEAHRSFQSDQ